MFDIRDSVGTLLVRQKLNVQNALSKNYPRASAGWIRQGVGLQHAVRKKNVQFNLDVTVPSNRNGRSGGDFRKVWF